MEKTVLPILWRLNCEMDKAWGRNASVRPGSGLDCSSYLERAGVGQRMEAAAGKTGDARCHGD